MSCKFFLGNHLKEIIDTFCVGISEDLSFLLSPGYVHVGGIKFRFGTSVIINYPFCGITEGNRSVA